MSMGNRSYNTDNFRKNNAVSLFDFDTSRVKRRHVKRFILAVFLIFLAYFSFGVYKKYQYQDIYKMNISDNIGLKDESFFYYGYVNSYTKLSLNSVFYGMTGRKYLGKVDNMDKLYLISKVNLGKAKLVVYKGDKIYKTIDVKSGKQRIDVPVGDNYKVHFIGDYFFGSCKFQTTNV